MIERLLVLIAIGLVVVALGQLGRVVARRRRHAAMETVHLEASTSGQPRIVSFYGPSCDACDRQKRELSGLEADRLGRLSIELHDATVDYDYARRFGLMVVPTTVVIDPAGTIRGINSGFTARSVLEGQLDAA